MEFDIERLRELARLMQEHDLRELEIKDDDSSVKLSRGGVQPAASVQYVAAPPAAGGSPAAHAHAGAGAPAAPAPAAAGVATDHTIRSPIVGTFYRSPAPGAPAFCEVGQRVRKGQAVCIIEAMKLMNEIESDVTGTILEVLAENGAPIEYDQPLFRVRPD